MPNSLGEEITVRYPRWMRIAVVLGTLLFFAIAAGLIFIEGQYIRKSWFALILLIAPLKMLHLGMVGFRLWPFLQCSFTASPKGIHITYPDNRYTDYEWSDIAAVNDRYVMQVFEARNQSGTLLFAVDYCCPQLERFKDRVINRVKPEI